MYDSGKRCLKKAKNSEFLQIGKKRRGEKGNVITQQRT
jgi:hypothetical protein